MCPDSVSSSACPSCPHVPMITRTSLRAFHAASQSPPSPPSRSPLPCSHLLITCFSIFCLLVTFVTGNTDPLPSSPSDPIRSYLILIDAGSSGTRIHVHPYYWMPGDDIPVIEPSQRIKVKPGLSTFASNPRDAGESIKPLLTFAQQHVPQELWNQTPLYLQATAGFRTLDSDIVEHIFDACRDVMEQTPFLFHRSNVHVISGHDEGLAGWIAINYLSGTFAATSNGSSIGVIEMGGASLQLTFAPTDAAFTHAPPEHVHIIHMGRHTYHVYTHSYLGYGLETAQLAYDEYHKNASDEPHDLAMTVHACYPQYLRHVTAGNYNHCYHAMSVLFAEEESTPQSNVCPHASCSFRGIYQPHITMNDHFIAIENFFYTTEFFAIQDHPQFVHALAAAGTEYCALSWHDIPVRWPKEPLDDLHKYCFSAAYIRQVLHRGLQFNDDTIRNVKIKRNIGGVNIDWALGGVLLQITSSPRPTTATPTTTPSSTPSTNDVPPSPPHGATPTPADEL